MKPDDCAELSLISGAQKLHKSDFTFYVRRRRDDQRITSGGFVVKVKSNSPLLAHFKLNPHMEPDIINEGRETG